MIIELAIVGILCYLLGRLASSIARDKDVEESRVNWTKAKEAWDKAEDARKSTRDFHDKLIKLLDDNEDRITIAMVGSGHECHGCGRCEDED